MNPRLDNSRHIKARTGSTIKAKHWTTEAAFRVLSGAYSRGGMLRRDYRLGR